MGLGGSPNDFGFMFILIFGATVALAIIIGLGGLVSRLLGRITGITSGWLGFVLLAILGGGLILAGSLYMDVLAGTTTGMVTAKNEAIDVRADGGWWHDYNLQIQYPNEGQDSYVNLTVGEERFDSLRQGEETELRVVTLWHSVALARLADLNTIRLLLWALPRLLLVGLAILGVWLVTRVKSRLGCALLFLMGLVAAVAVPAFLTYRAWQAAEDLDGRPLQAQATVASIERITNVDYFPCETGDCSDHLDTAFDVPQQFDVVQLRFQPEERPEPVLAADTADAGTFSAAEGQVVTIAYDPARPRDVLIVGAVHSHHWRNVVHFAWAYVGLMVIIYGLFFLVLWIGGRGLRWFASSRAAAGA